MGLFSLILDILAIPGQIIEVPLHMQQGYNKCVAQYGVLQDAMIYKQVLEDRGIKSIVDGDFINGYRVMVK